MADFVKVGKESIFDYLHPFTSGWYHSLSKNHLLMLLHLFMK